MQICVHDELDREDLASALLSVGCSAVPVGTTLDLTQPDATDGPTELELRFFLRAWRGLHPHVRLELL